MIKSDKIDKLVFPLITEEESKLPFTLKSIGIHENQIKVIRTEGHHEYHWLHCIKGSGMLKIEGNEYLISENMGFFMNPKVPHEYYPVKEPWETHWITFEGYAVSGLLDLLQLTNKKVFYIQDINIIEKIFWEILFTANEKSPARGFEASILLYSFLINFRSCSMINNKTKFMKQNQLEPVIEFLETNFAANPTLEYMSSIIGVTQYHLCRLFKEAFGMRPFEYLTKMRIQKAKEYILKDNKLSIKELSIIVGYNDTSYFCSMFKEHEGMTPTEFRGIYKNYKCFNKEQP